MTLPVPNLDDRRFQNLVDEAKRLIPTYCPSWTNHNVSDPGVALIELFAWMTEMTIFRLNQVPDVFYTHMLNLAGFEPFPATAARTDITFWLVGPVADDPVVVPAQTQVATSGTIGESRVFSTVDDLVIRRPKLIGALTSSAPDSYVDVWDDLRIEHGAVVCFPRSPMTAGDSFYIAFEQSVAGNAIQLTTRSNIDGIGVVPDKPPLEWQVYQGEAWVPVTVASDTTGGLNADGVIVLLVPPVHEPSTLGGVRGYWMRACLLPSEPGQPSYRASPQIKTMHAESIGGMVTAEHSEPIAVTVLGTSTGSADERFAVEFAPVMPRLPHERVVVIGPDGAETPWQEVPDFSASGPDDRHVVWDSTTGVIRFGPSIRYPDGKTRQHGARPPEGGRVTVTGYRHGGGAAGNVGRGTLTALRTTIPHVHRVENREAATGGVDGETVANAKLRGPQTLRAGARAVTAADYERLAAQADPSIARVRCLPPAGPGRPIRLLLVPAVDKHPREVVLDDFAIPDGMMRAVSDYLEVRRILGTSIEIGTPYYQGVTVAALVTARPNRPATSVRERALDALYSYVNPLGGGADKNGWAFDNDLNVTALYQMLEAVDGVERVEEVLLFDYDLRNDRRTGPAKEQIRLEPQSLFLSRKHQVVVR